MTREQMIDEAVRRFARNLQREFWPRDSWLRAGDVLSRIDKFNNRVHVGVRTEFRRIKAEQ